MPIRPRKQCNYPGCGRLVQGGYRYCANHEQKAKAEADKAKRARDKSYDKKRGTRTERGYSNRWGRARAAFLRENPLCEECLKSGIFTAATVVDHIEPHKGDDVLFWDEGNWQALCPTCHNRKTAKEDGGFGNTFR